MNDLAELTILACIKAVEGSLFDDADDVDNGGQAEPTVYDSFLLKNASGHQPKKEHPFILVRPVGSKEGQEASNIFVPIQCGIHTHKNTDDGVKDIRRLAELVVQGLKSNKQFTPYSLDKIIVTLGDPEDGFQPHPKYYANLELTFSRAPVLSNF